MCEWLKVTQESLQRNVCVQQRLEFIVVNSGKSQEIESECVTFILRTKHTKKYSEDTKTNFACVNHL